MRTWKYKKKLEEGAGEELAEACWEETKRWVKREVAGDGWEEERKQFIKKKG